jgi:hypothetical protein
MRFTIILLTGLVTGLGLVLVQHDALAQQAPAPKTDAELIANAMSAAPAAISKDATIVIVDTAGKLQTLRQGQGPFTCMPDDPNTPGHDPMCLDRNGFEWLKSLLAHEKPPEGKLWFGYMLKGSSDASIDDPYATEPPAGKKWIEAGPHVMIGGPGIAKMLGNYPASADDTSKPHTMFGGTPYEYLVLPVE